MNISGAIFDFDGTLFDSMHVWAGIRDRYFEKAGIVLSEEDKEAFKGVYLRESLILAKQRFNLEQSYEELFCQFFEFIKELYLSDTKPKNDIIEFLERLKERGVKIGIATASGEPAVEAALEKYGMREYFQVILSTYTVGSAKTESTLYDTVLQKLGTERESTWIFEDAVYAAATARKSGYKVVGIYDKSEHDQQTLGELCDIYITNYSEIEL